MGASKAALILMKNSHFDRTLQQPLLLYHTEQDCSICIPSIPEVPILHTFKQNNQWNWHEVASSKIQRPTPRKHLCSHQNIWLHFLKKLLECFCKQDVSMFTLLVGIAGIANQNEVTIISSQRQKASNDRKYCLLGKILCTQYTEKT